MIKGYKLLFATMLGMLSANHAIAQDVQIVDGVKYTISGDYAVVGDNTSAIGAVTIKDTIEVTNGETEEVSKYAVKAVSEGAFQNCSGLLSITFPKGIKIIGANAFQGCGLTTVVLPDSLVTIGEHAFHGSMGLTSVTFPKKLQTIGSYAFSTMKLQSVTIPKKVKSIGSAAFSYNSELTTITVDAANKVYDSRNGCNAILETASGTLIAGCSSTVIPDGTKIIGENAFNGCTGLKEVTIPFGVTSIGNGAFHRCTSLTTVNIPASVTTIGSSFSQCTALNTIVCRAEKVLALTGDPFEDTPVRVFVFVNKKLVEQYQSDPVWSKMTIVGYVPGDANSDLAVNVADVMEDVNYVQGTPTNRLDNIGADATGDNLITSADVDAIATAIKSGLYSAAAASLKPVTDEKLAVDNVEVKSGTSATVPVTLTSANAYSAFQIDVTLPEGITLTGVTSGDVMGGKTVESAQLNASTWRLFWYSPTKEALTAGTGVLLQLALTKSKDLKETKSVALSNIIFADAAAKATMLTNLSFNIIQPAVQPFAVKTAEGVDLTFKATDLTETACLVGNGEQAAVAAATSGTVTIPAEADGIKVTGIADNAFSGCAAITSVVIPEGVKTIGAKAFSGCTALTTITLPASITTIADNAFENCPALIISLTLQQLPLVKGSVKLAITANTNTSITSISIPANVVSIAPKLTSNCTQLTSITVDADNSVYDSRVSCNAIIETDTHTLIAGCRATNIPDNVMGIGPWAFEGQPAIKEVVFSGNISTIGEGAFAGCTGITAVTLNMETPPTITENTFSSEAYKNATLTIQNTLSRTRIAGTPWENFLKIKVLYVDPDEDANPTIFVISEEDKTAVVGNGVDPCLNSTIEGKITIPAVKDGYRVTTIAAKAFMGCSKLTSIVIPAGVTTIGASAFKGCSGLTTIELPSSVTTIAADAFEGCTALTVSCSLQQVPLVKGSVKLAITGNTNTGITSISIPANVVSIAAGLTSNCTQLTSITVDAGNTVYDSRLSCNAIIVTASNTLLAGCVATTVPNGVTTIANSAFEGQTGLKTVTLPATVSLVSDAAFAGCTGITTVTLNGSVPPSIGTTSFPADVYRNATLSLPNTLARNRIAGTVWENFYHITVREEDTPDVNQIAFAVVSEEAKTCQVGNGTEAATSPQREGTVTIPAQSNGYKVTVIASNAFQGCAKITSVVIPEGVTTIGSSAFQGCTALTSITLPSTVTSIATNAFTGCTSLTINASLQQSILIKDNVKVAVTHTTTGNMTNILITKQTVSLASRLFATSPAITSIEVETGNTVFDSRNSCNAVIVKATNTLLFGCKATVIPTSVTAIAASAFENQTGLKSVVLPASVTSIGESAFAGCTGITTVTLNSSIPPTITSTTFPSEVYKNATLSLPNTLARTRIAGTLWEDFAHITVREDDTPSDSQITFAVVSEESKTCQVGNGKEAAAAATTEGKVSIPAQNNGYKVTVIAPYAFQGCTKITSVVIPEGVTTIGSAAFKGCTALTSITLPSTVTTIASDAFNGCTSLTINASLQQSTLIKDDVKVAVTHTELKNMETVVITRQTISLASRLLSNCPAIRYITVESGNTIYDSRNTCNAVIVKATNTLLFGCRSTVIPADVTAIAPWAFEGHTGLTSITLLSGITSIGEGAFSGCTGLGKVTLKMTPPPAITANTFSEETYAQATLVVPEGTTDKLAGTSWARFVNIQEDTTGSAADLATAKTKLEADLKELIELEEQASKLYNADYDNYIMTYSDISSVANAILDECPSVRLSIASSGYTTIQKQNLNEELLDIQDSSESVARQAFDKQSEASNVKNSVSQALSNYFAAETKIREALKNAKKASDLNEANQLLKQTSQALTEAISKLQKLYDMSDVQVLKAANQGNRSRLDALKSKVSQGPKPIKVGDVVTSGDYTYTVLAGLRLSVSAANKYLTPSCSPADIIVYGENQYTISEIGKEGFAYCNNLQWTTLKDGLETLREGAFRGCQQMTSIDLSRTTQFIERYALGFPNLASIVLPKGNPYFVKIENHLYSADEKLLVRFLPIIGGEFTIPEKLTDILGGAFVGATKLTKIIVDKRTPLELTDEDAFDGLDFANCVLSVPNGSGDLYRAAKGWNKFLMIEEYHGEDDEPVVVTALSYTREYGDENPEFGFESTGARLDGVPQITCSAKPDDKPGTYPIIIQKGSVKNYNDSYVGGTLTVTKATLKVSVKDAERDQYEENPEFEIVYEGFKLNDTPASLMMEPVARSAAKKDSPAGVYTIAVSGGMDLNYNFEYTNGKLTVNEVSGIVDLTVEPEFDVYTTTGLLVKRRTTTLKGLRRGVYIVNGKKVAVK